MGAMAAVADTCFVDLRQDGDEDTLRVGLTVRLDVPFDAMGPADHLTCVSLCVDRLCHCSPRTLT